MSKDQWIAKEEQACDDYTNGTVDLEYFKTEMQELGFDQNEINTKVTELDLDRNSI